MTQDNLPFPEGNGGRMARPRANYTGANYTGANYTGAIHTGAIYARDRSPAPPPRQRHKAPNANRNGFIAVLTGREFPRACSDPYAD